jgi:hypothetical protein
MAHPVPRYAKTIVSTMRADAAAEKKRTEPVVDTAEVVSRKGGVQIQPSNSTVTYVEDDILWNIDPDSLKVGDVVTMLRDPTENPIVLGLIDGMQPDPAIHPNHIRLKTQFDRLRANAATWKSPVLTLSELPQTGNRQGDVRLVLGINRLYRWRAGNKIWVPLSAGSGGPVSSLDDLLDVNAPAPQVGDALVWDGTSWVNQPVAGSVTDVWVDTSGDTMTGPLVMSPGTHITLPDPPVNPTDAVNKAYVDAMIAAALTALMTTLVPTVVVTTPTYTATPNDQVILVNYCTGQATITLPANHIMDKVYEIKDAGGCASVHNHQIVSADGDTIDGLPSFALTMDWQSVTVLSDGTNWHII